MPTPGNDVNSERYVPPPYAGNAAHPQQHALPLQNVPVAPYPVQQYHDPELPPAYETISDFPLYPSDLQLNVTPSVQAGPNDAWSRFYNGSQVQVPANNQQWNVQPSATFNNIPYSAPTTNPPVINTTQTSVPVWPQETVSRNQRRGNPCIGILMIILAIAHIGIGIGLTTNYHGGKSSTISSGIPFWGAALHIITGSVNIAAHASLTRCKVICAIILTVGTLIVSAIDLVINVKDFNNAHDCWFGSGHWGPSKDCFNAMPYYWGLVSTNGFILFLSLISLCFGCCAFRKLD
ncbi:membrane-spanning 4-domains subfamily A member 8-like [Hyperolius riggenbachi]|uniref:membrane-spanning 4-domains subfamily A member 8-like n=1 Tax=Hyperolius riggenbachi TaxID=752182 RepID=UPI0035A2AA7B